MLLIHDTVQVPNASKCIICIHLSAELRVSSAQSVTRVSPFLRRSLPVAVLCSVGFHHRTTQLALQQHGFTVESRQGLLQSLDLLLSLCLAFLM